jgi:hypothetical protein
VIKDIFRISTEGVKSALLLFSAVIMFSAVNAGAAEISGTVVAVKGDVHCRRQGFAAVRTVRIGDAVQVADLLETGKTGKMQLLLSDETLITIMPESALRISQYSFDRDVNRMSLVASLKQGRARFVLYKERKGGASLKIETDQALIQTSRADIVVAASGQQTEIFTIAGSAGIRNSSNLVVGNVRVGENMSVVVHAAKPPTSPSVIPMQQRRRFIKDARQF